MAETHGFIRILPDSTGKRIPQTVMVEVDYNNGTIPIVVGDTVTATTSNIVATVYEVEGTTSSGSLHVKVEDPVQNNVTFTVGENLQVNAVTVAKVATTGYLFYYQQLNIMGAKNPTNGWDIQDDGSGLVSFPEGAPSFDAFGKMLVAQQTTMAEYLNKYEMDTSKSTNIFTGTASITHDSSSAGLVFSTGTASGDKAERMSNQYHPYQLGKSRLIEFTCAVGDTGKANVERHWGYGDNQDGLFFSLVGTTFNVRLKSSVTGSVVSTYYPQSEWNHDRLDGTKSVFNPSGILLDVTKDNIYWIDFQWLGAGKVRFGIIGSNGRRIVCHTIENANQNNCSYMRTGTLPVYFEQKNSGTAASTSEFRLWCCVVKQGGEFKPQKAIYALPTVTKTLTDTSAVPIISIRSKQLVNTMANRLSSFIEALDVMSTNAMVEFNIYDNSTLTGASFIESTKAVEYDTSATAMPTGTLIDSFFVASSREKSVDMSLLFNFIAHALRRSADITVAPHTVTITAKLVAAGTSEIRVSATISDV